MAKISKIGTGVKLANSSQPWRENTVSAVTASASHITASPPHSRALGRVGPRSLTQPPPCTNANEVFILSALLHAYPVETDFARNKRGVNDRIGR